MTSVSTKLSESKAVLLYLLYKIDLPLMNSQITRFIIENNIMNYFTLQQDLDELVTAQFINKSKNLYYYTLTGKGKSSLQENAGKIPRRLMKLIDKYWCENMDLLKREAQITARYKKINDKEYMVHCKVIENGIVLIELKLNVVSIEQAKLICDKWKTKAATVYQNVIVDLVE